jgi:4-amino-4-deoxy-L-arabinose transferase-like glycosyltransferase
MNGPPPDFSIAVMPLLILAAITLLWLWTLVDAIRNPRLDNNMRLIWVVVIILTSLLGSLLYLLFGRYPKPAA